MSFYKHQQGINYSSIFNKYRRFGFQKTVDLIYYGFKFLFHRLTGKRYLKRNVHDFVMSLDLMLPGVSRDLAISGTREEQLVYVLRNTVKKGGIVLDLGANIGYYTLMLANLVGDGGFVYAVEPAIENYELLQQNVTLNNFQDRVETFRFAISNKKGVEKLYLSEYSNMHSLNPNIDFSRKQYINIDVVDLHSFLSNKPDISLIRMDVEGYEVEILEGLQPAIEEGIFKGEIVFEVHMGRYNDENHNMKRQLEMLFRNGYAVSLLTSNDEKTAKIGEKYSAKLKIQVGDSRISGLYENISPEDAIDFVCYKGGVRDILLSK